VRLAAPRGAGQQRQQQQQAQAEADRQNPFANLRGGGSGEGSGASGSSNGGGSSSSKVMLLSGGLRGDPMDLPGKSAPFVFNIAYSAVYISFFSSLLLIDPLTLTLSRTHAHSFPLTFYPLLSIAIFSRRRRRRLGVGRGLASGATAAW